MGDRTIAKPSQDNNTQNREHTTNASSEIRTHDDYLPAVQDRAATVIGHILFTTPTNKRTPTFR